MQDDMTFQGPLDTFNTADQYLEASRRLASIIQRIDLKKMFVDGEDVCVLYDMVTNTPAGTAFIAEGTAIDGGGQFGHLSHSLDSTLDSPYPCFDTRAFHAPHFKQRGSL
jgi:hypothetical protein